MAESKLDIKPTFDEYISLNVEANIPVGSPMLIQNTSSVWGKLVESSTKPSTSFDGGIMITPLYQSEPSKEIPSGSLEIWAKSMSPTLSVNLAVQEI